MNASSLFTVKTMSVLVPAIEFGSLISSHLLKRALCSTLRCESKWHWASAPATAHRARNPCPEFSAVHGAFSKGHKEKAQGLKAQILLDLYGPTKVVP
jgi:hypothetical protein